MIEDIANFISRTPAPVLIVCGVMVVASLVGWCFFAAYVYKRFVIGKPPAPRPGDDIWEDKMPPM